MTDQRSAIPQDTASAASDAQNNTTSSRVPLVTPGIVAAAHDSLMTPRSTLREVRYGRPTVSPGSAGAVGGDTRYNVACSNA